MMHIITILRIIVCFQRRHKGAFDWWFQCLLWQRQKKRVIPEHTRLYWAKRQRLHGRYPVAESWRGPGGDCCKTALQDGLQYIRCTLLFLVFPSTKQSYTGQNAPCVWQILAAARSEGWHLPDKIMIIMCILRSYTNIYHRKNIKKASTCQIPKKSDNLKSQETREVNCNILE